MGAIILNAAQVREMIAKALRDSIDDYRAARASLDPTYEPPSGEVTREEVDHFIAANPDIDFPNANMLYPPGSLGSDDNFALRVRSEVYEEFQDEFDEIIRGIAEEQIWLENDDKDEVFGPVPGLVTPAQRHFWVPERQHIRPQWIDSSRSALLLARELIEEGRFLSEMEWRDFEKLIAELLERDGWEIQLMRGTKDGGIDVISSRNDAVVGRLKAIWQAKRYGEGHKVQLAHARELSGVVERERASKGVLVTTTSLTKGAIKWIKQDEFRLDAKDGEAVKRWIEQYS